jgi:cell division protein FtsI (penicillin-binding protein 3)
MYPNYEIGGKTGTADQVLRWNLILMKQKINTFASIFPTSNPQFVFRGYARHANQKAKDYYYKYRHQKGGWTGNLI